MAIPAQPTLRELKESLLQRLGLATAGSAPAKIDPIVGERLRQAQTHLHTKLDLTRLWVMRDVPLQVGVAQYDHPDDCEIGDLRRMSVLDDRGQEYPLEPGTSVGERASAAQWNGQDPAAGYDRPRVFTLQNQVLNLTPPPSETYVTLRMEYFVAPSKLVDDADRCSVDPEALLLWAEYLLRIHFGMNAVAETKTLFDDYMLDLQTKQGDGNGFQIGGQQPARLRTFPQNRLGSRLPYGFQPGMGVYGRQTWL